MNKEKLRKLIGIIGTVIGIAGFALCVISIFVAADIQNVIVKVAVALIIFDVVVIGICSRIFQTKDAVITAKRIYRDLKKESSPTGKDSDEFIDSVSCGLKSEQRNCENNYLGVPYAYKATNKHLERLKVLAKRDVSAQLVEANVSNAQVIWEMQKIAFAELLQKYGDYETSPANETLDKVKSRLEDPNTYHYFIKAEEQTVGVIRVVDSKSQEKKRLAQIFIMPKYRLKGYARSAIKSAENIHGSTGWVVETILQERHLLRLYMSLGYRVKNQSKKITSNMILIVLEK